jgi:sigma-B regulation protein RsbU (phosphoserine phosphatase)
VIGDVSGKGIPAALFMMVTNILISDRTTMGGSPAEILSFVNDNICPRNQAEMFVTVWLGILEISTGRLTAANAGHEYPALKRPDGSFALLKDKHSFVVGGMEGVKYREYELQLEPGTKLFLYTDGVPEATDAGNAMFGAQRMLAALDRASEGTPEELLRSVRGSVDEFVGDAEQFDDLTMLCLHYRGPAARELRTEALIENIPAITEFVERELEKLDCPPKARIQLDIAIDELVSNVAKYAYSPETGPVTVRVEVEKEPTAVILSFIDGGRPYDPLAAGDPDVTASAEERGVGGLGVYMVKRSMDDVSYEYKDGQNILRIRKNL